MMRNVLGGAIAALVILSDRLACVAFALVLIVAVRVIAAAVRGESASHAPVVHVRL